MKASDVDKANFLLDTFKDFERLNYFTDYIPFINSHPFYGSGINKLKCYAFHYYILSDISNSKKYFNKILEFETQQNSEWYEDDILIAKEFINYIDSKSFDKGICKLLQWQNDTIEQLKLDI